MARSRPAAGLSYGEQYNVVHYAASREEAERYARQHPATGRVAKVKIDNRGSGSWKWRVINVYHATRG